MKTLLLLLLAALTTTAADAQHPSVDRLDGVAFSAACNASATTGVGLLSGADGVVDRVERGGTPCVMPHADSEYLYFRITGDASTGTAGPIYVVVDYFDEVVGSSGLRLDYDSAEGDDIAARYLPADDQAGGMLLDTGRWRSAAFLLKRPAFRKRQNCGADFRLSGGRPIVRSVRLCRARPAGWDRMAIAPDVQIRQLVHIGPGGQLIVGGFDPAHASDAAPQARALESAIPALKQLGVTSHEGYVRWNLCEIAPGKYDWSVYDRFVDVYRRNGLKWVPFLIVGSAYSLPDWYYKSSEAQGYVCLEHGEECDVQSHWNPRLREHVERFIRAFCEHYRDTGAIESILLGITGNYGEAIYPVTGNDWTADIHGPYHSHPGYWAGDKYAVQSFRAWLTRKYAGSDALRRAWRTTAVDLATVRPLLQKEAPDDRAWLDMVDWYTQSMTDWARFWLRTTRMNFPNGDIYLCTGGHAPPEHGADFGAQCKAAAEFGAGVRITNEGSDLKANFSLTRWVASAARQYGAYFGFEPAGRVDAGGVIARIYNASTAGARGLHYYYPNLFDTAAAHNNFVRWGFQFRQRRPVQQIAVFYPSTYIKLHGNDFLRFVQPLRARFDFDYMSEGQIADGGLAGIRALILLDGCTAEAAAWRRVVSWVRSGGLLLCARGMGRLRTVEGADWPDTQLFGSRPWIGKGRVLSSADSPLGKGRVISSSSARVCKRDAISLSDVRVGKGRVVSFTGAGDTPDFRDLVTSELHSAPELSPAARAMVAADGVEDGVFVSLCDQDELVWLNTTPNTVHKTVPVDVDLPPWSITSRRVQTGR